MLGETLRICANVTPDHQAVLPPSCLQLNLEVHVYRLSLSSGHRGEGQVCLIITCLVDGGEEAAPKEGVLPGSRASGAAEDLSL